MTKTMIQISEALFLDVLFPNAGIEPRIISITYDQVNARLMLAIDGLPSKFSGGLRTIDVATNIGGIPFVFDLPRVGDGADGGTPVEPASSEQVIPSPQAFVSGAPMRLASATQIYSIHGANAP